MQEVARKKSGKPPLKGTTVKFEPEMEAELGSIAASERRSKAAVIRGLLERGLLLYKADGELFPLAQEAVQEALSKLESDLSGEGSDAVPRSARKNNSRRQANRRRGKGHAHGGP
jgi:hypothetical protein